MVERLSDFDTGCREIAHQLIQCWVAEFEACFTFVNAVSNCVPSIDDPILIAQVSQHYGCATMHSVCVSLVDEQLGKS